MAKSSPVRSFRGWYLSPIRCCGFEFRTWAEYAQHLNAQHRDERWCPLRRREGR